MNIVKSNQITFTRPNDSTQYAAGDLVADTTSNATVTNRLFVFKRCRGPIRIRKWLFQKTDNDTTSASFLLMLFSAAPIDPAAVGLAQRFVRAMPDGMPLPEFGPEPDGSISLDWIDSRNRMFSLSIGRNNRLAYAWLDGTDKGHGVASFDGYTIPPRVFEGVSRIAHQGRAVIRAA